MRQVTRILVATDFSEHSEKAVETGVFLAKAHGASIDLVHALAAPWSMVTPYDVSTPTIYLEDVRQSARRSLLGAVEKAQAEGVEVQSHLSEAPAAEAIVSCAKEFESDLIVMGTHGYTGLKHVLLGSVAERTLRTAPCAVLTVKAADVE